MTTPFLHCSYFRAHPTTLLLKILAVRMHGPCPSSNFGGTVPPVPLGLRPCLTLTTNTFPRRNYSPLRLSTRRALRAHGGNSPFHGRFSIIVGACPGCSPPVYAYA